MLRRVAKLLVEHEMNPMVWLVWRAKQWEGDGEPPLGFLLAPNLLAQGRFRGLARSQTPPTGLMQYKPRLHRELLVGRWEELRGYVGMLSEDAPAGSMALLTASIFPLDELQRLQAAYADAAKVALYEAWRNMQHGQWIWPTY